MTNLPMLDGLLLVDKPVGPSSFGVVSKTRGILKSATGIKMPKVGHTGTLDPLASGLMVLVLGSYCKRANEFSKLDKVYEVEFVLGTTSTTDDAEGERTIVSSDKPSQEAVVHALQSFVGTIQQVPPVYSAIKVDGQRAYKLARKGESVTLKSREVTVYGIERLTYTYPSVTCTVSVSSGTYIRSLVRDIGQLLGTGAYMSQLRRTKVGNFAIEDAVSMEDLSYETISRSCQSI